MQSISSGVDKMIASGLKLADRHLGLPDRLSTCVTWAARAQQVPEIFSRVASIEATTAIGDFSSLPEIASHLNFARLTVDTGAFHLKKTASDAKGLESVTSKLVDVLDKQLISAGVVAMAELTKSIFGDIPSNEFKA
jgi:hypothetical protein